MNKFLFITVILASVFTVSCKTICCKKNAKTTTTKSQSEKPLEDVQWQLVYIANGAKDIKADFPLNIPTITFDKKKGIVYGTSGCNRYNMTYNTENYKLTFPERGASTMMYCKDVEEAAFLEKLQKVTSYSILEGQLTLIAGDIGVLVFKPSETKK